VDLIEQPDGRKIAQHIVVHERPTYEFTAVLEAINGNIWTIMGYPILVDEETQIIGQPQVGDVVDVKVEQLEDGTLHALYIAVRATATPTPSATPTPTASPVPYYSTLKVYVFRHRGIHGRAVTHDSTTLPTSQPLTTNRVGPV